MTATALLLDYRSQPIRLLRFHWTLRMPDARACSVESIREFHFTLTKAQGSSEVMLVAPNGLHHAVPPVVVTPNATYGWVGRHCLSKPPQP